MKTISRRTARAVLACASGHVVGVLGAALLIAAIAPVPVKPRPIAIPAPRSPQHVLEPTSVS